MQTTTFNAQGQVTRITNPQGIIGYEYDTLNRLDTLTHYRGVAGSPATDTDLSDNPKVAEFDYTVAANGQRTALTERFWIDEDATADVVNSYSWTYDGLNRLTDEIFTTNLDDVLDGQTAIALPATADLSSANRMMRDYHDRYSFDLTGNRLRKTTDLDPDGDSSNGFDGFVDLSTTSAYDANDRLLHEVKVEHVEVGPEMVTATLYEYDQTQQTEKTVYRNVAENLSSLPDEKRTSSMHFAFNLQGRLSVATNTTFDGTTGTEGETMSGTVSSALVRVKAAIWFLTRMALS